MSGDMNQADMDRVNEALFAGRFIEAIKVYRTATGAGLKESKDFIEALEARLRAEMPAKFTAPLRTSVELGAAGCAAILIGIVALVAAIVWMLR